MPKKKQTKTYLVCYGTPSPRAVIVGESDFEPEVGKPVTLRNVRMVLYWSGGGLHGLIADGPRAGSRITAPTPQYAVTVAEWGELTARAITKLREFPPC